MISHSHNFIFIHVPKTGGTFLNELIRAHCEVVRFELHRPVVARDREPNGVLALRHPQDRPDARVEREMVGGGLELGDRGIEGAPAGG